MPDRRHVLRAAVAASVSGGLHPPLSGAAVVSPAEDTGKAVQNGRVKQSLVFWCFNARGDKWDAEKTCGVAKQLGLPSVELIGPEHWPTLKRHGLTCAIAPNGMPGAPYMRGFNNPAFHAENLDRTGKMIDACKDAGFPAVITFVGYRWPNPDDPKSGEITADDARKHCVKGLKELARHAERQGVTVCLEHLNSRDGTDPMKGHPGYQGDDLDFCAEVLRAVGSPRVKLLFDIYHVQIMHGDLIRRLEAVRELIGHVHTAGVPGRGELDADQEVNYPAVLKKLVQVGYAGYVGQEFIPTRDPLAGLRQAVRACDV